MLVTIAPSAYAAFRQLAAWSLVDGFSWETAFRVIDERIHLVVHIARGPGGFRHVAETASLVASDAGCTLRSSTSFAVLP
ncbi:MAG: hypothetical protein F4X39_00155 [Acidobacteriia bacterium]|nr:hypothetical protein [Terriglobia bacterium]